MPQRPRDAIATAFAVAAVVTAIFAIGGAVRWAQALTAAFAALAIAPQILSRRAFARMSPLTVILAVASAVTALQLVPLPSGLLAALDPVGTSLREDGAALVDAHPWTAITHDVPGTLRALAFFLTLWAIATVSLRYAMTERGRYRCLAVVALLCGVVALVVGLHELFGVTSLYGLYTPTQAGPHLVGPLLNLNHLACLTTMGAIVSVSLAWYRNQKGWVRVLWIVIAASDAMISMSSVSRGATLSLAAGVLATIALLIGQTLVSGDPTRRKRPDLLRNTLPLGVVVLCTAIVVVYASAGNVRTQLSQTTMHELESSRSKFGAWHSALDLIEETPWVGVGRGGFEPTFTRVHHASAFNTYSNLENEYLQAVVDWGIPIAIVLGICFVWLLTRCIRRWREGPLAAGALGAFVAVLLQSNVDFGVELLGVAAPLTVVIATLAYSPLREVTGRRLVVTRGLRVAHVFALAVVGILLLLPVTTTLEEDHIAMTDAKQPDLASLRGVIERHPFDYFGYAAAAKAMLRNGDPRAVRVLNHALTLHPTHSGLHLIAARLLFEANRVDQAAIEYGSALRGARDQTTVMRELVTRLPSNLAAHALPIDDESLDGTQRILAELRQPEVEVAWLVRVLKTHPNQPQACELLYGAAIRFESIDIAARARTHCTSYEMTHGYRLQLAELMMKKRAFDAVIELLQDAETWTGILEERNRGWLQLCDAYIEVQKWDDAKRCLRRLDASGTIPPDQAGQLAARFEKIQSLRDAAPKPD
jgi:O-antigen ligase